MSKEEEKTITLTSSELESIIRSAVKNALRDLKDEEKLPVNEVDERKEAPASFTLLELMSTGILWSVIVGVIIVIAGCIKLLFEKGFDLLVVMMMISFAVIGFLCFCATRELQKTKKIEVLNTVFTAIMALSSLIVAIVGAVFAYQALK